jgi:hypothetical protein
MSETPIKTTLLTRVAIEQLICNENFDFLLAFGKDGQLERFVPDCGCSDLGPVTFPVPAGEITDIQQYDISVVSVQQQAAALTCVKYCTIGTYTYCCKWA